MLIHRTHITHFDLTENTHVIPHPSIVQLTGTWGACKRLAFSLGLELRSRDEIGPESFRLVDSAGMERGQLHHHVTGNQLVFKQEWFEHATR